MTLLGDARTWADTAAPVRRPRLVPRVAMGLDLVVVAAAVLAAMLLRERPPLFGDSAEVSPHLDVVAPLMIVGWLVVIHLFGGYRDDVFGSGTEEAKRVFNATLLSGGLLGVGCYLTKFPLSRGFFLIAFALGSVGLLLGRHVLRKAIHRARRRGSLHQSVLLVGPAADVDEIAQVLQRERWLGYRILGAVTPCTDERPETPGGVPVVGHTDVAAGADDIPALVGLHGADVLVFAGGGIGSGRRLRQVMWQLEQLDVRVVVAPGVNDVSAERVAVRPVGGLPLLHIAPPTWADAARLGKRTFDIVGSLLALVLLSPLFVLAAVAIRLDDRGPVVFRQTRLGRDGQEFSCLKFRSMVLDAEARLAELHLAQGFETGLFKMHDDPRVTRPGRWLRRFSVDELPQLVNVLRGEMSLVGPRPPLPSEVAQYGADAARRLRVRPGLTGLWQVSGRSDLPWDEAIRLDLYYVDNWSMLQDLSILSRTVAAVVRSQGAY